MSPRKWALAEEHNRREQERYPYTMAEVQGRTRHLQNQPRSVEVAAVEQTREVVEE